MDAWRRRGVAAAAAVRAVLAGLVWAGVAQAASATPAASSMPPLRIVGGLAGINQFTRHEEPFWSQRLAELSGGRYRAEVVPFDRAGIRGAEVLSLVRLGTLPFGTMLLSVVSPRDAELAGADLAGASRDAATLRRVVAAWRPHLQTLLRERHGAELLAVYAYPAQVLFCNRPIAGLAGLRGLRVRTSSPTQADFVQALGGQPLTVPFAAVVQNMQAGNMDCAITGTMSGYTIGLHQITTHMLPLPVSWGLSVFVANGERWASLPADLRTLLQREIPRLEAAIWDEAERETQEGIRCSTGQGACGAGPAGRMVLVAPSAQDEQRRLEALTGQVLPQWLQRCGADCADAWNRLLAPVLGVTVPAR